MEHPGTEPETVYTRNIAVINDEVVVCVHREITVVLPAPRPPRHVEFDTLCACLKHSCLNEASKPFRPHLTYSRERIRITICAGRYVVCGNFCAVEREVDLQLT